MCLAVLRGSCIVSKDPLIASNCSPKAEHMEDNLTDIVEVGGCSPTSVADSSTCDVPEGDVPEGEGQAAICSTTQHVSGDLMWWQSWP